MKRRRHTPEQVIHKLAEGEKLLGLGKDLGGGVPASGPTSAAAVPNCAAHGRRQRCEQPVRLRRGSKLI